MKLSLILLPIISAFIGWFTNWVAIKMLFHPREPKKILGFTLQGIFPKRQAQFAASLGQLVSKELISFEDIQQKISSPTALAKVTPLLEAKLDTYMRSKLSEHLPLVSMFISNDTLDKIKNGITQELHASIPQVMNQLGNELKQELDIEKIVVEKVSAFSSDKLEAILQAIMKKEFFFVEILGGVLGFIIGLVQVFISLL